MVQTPVLVIAESKPVDEILREYLTNITEEIKCNLIINWDIVTHRKKSE